MCTCRARMHCACAFVPVRPVLTAPGAISLGDIVAPLVCSAQPGAGVSHSDCLRLVRWQLQPHVRRHGLARPGAANRRHPHMLRLLAGEGETLGQRFDQRHASPQHSGSAFERQGSRHQVTSVGSPGAVNFATLCDIVWDPRPDHASEASRRYILGRAVVAALQMSRPRLDFVLYCVLPPLCKLHSDVLTACRQKRPRDTHVKSLKRSRASNVTCPEAGSSSLHRTAPDYIWDAVSKTLATVLNLKNECNSQGCHYVYST